MAPRERPSDERPQQAEEQEAPSGHAVPEKQPFATSRLELDALRSMLRQPPPRRGRPGEDAPVPATGEDGPNK